VTGEVLGAVFVGIFGVLVVILLRRRRRSNAVVNMPDIQLQEVSSSEETVYELPTTRSMNKKSNY
jgi:hypothetical protein